MDILHANSIPLRQILSKIDLTPTQETIRHLYYPSPFAEKDALSLLVDKLRNTWTDSQTGQGGNGMALVAALLQSQSYSHTTADCLRWLTNTVGFAPVVCPEHIMDTIPCHDHWTIKSRTSIENKTLQRYLLSRGIAVSLASQILQQARVRNSQTRKSFYALVSNNEDGGYSLYNPCLAGHILPLSIRFIRGREAKPAAIHVFKDVFDYLSALTLGKGKLFKSDAIILNGYSCLRDAVAYIRHYGYTQAYTWLENTEHGMEITQLLADFFKTEPDLKHIPMNALYRAHQSVNDRLVLTQQNHKGE